MKNVLIILSTPRKSGNSDVLCDEFAKGAIKGTKYTTAAYKLGLKVK